MLQNRIFRRDGQADDALGSHGVRVAEGWRGDRNPVGDAVDLLRVRDRHALIHTVRDRDRHGAVLDCARPVRRRGPRRRLQRGVGELAVGRQSRAERGPGVAERVLVRVDGRDRDGDLAARVHHRRRSGRAARERDRVRLERDALDERARRLPPSSVTGRDLDSSTPVRRPCSSSARSTPGPARSRPVRTGRLSGRHRT